MKQFFIALIGGMFVLIGVGMLVLPGPSLLVNRRTGDPSDGNHLGAACRAQCEKRGRKSPPQVWPERLAATAQDASRREAKAVVENLKGDSDQL
jgi:hypothetical protein